MLFLTLTLVLGACNLTGADLPRTLIFAATDTTSSALARILHLLAQHPDVQGQLRQEVIAARNGRDGIPYDELVELPYLDAVCRETLRL